MTTTHDDSKSINEFEKDALKETSESLAELKRLISIAAKDTADLPTHDALEFVEVFLHKSGFATPKSLKSMLIEARGGGKVQEPYHNEPLSLASETGAWGNLIVDRGWNLIAAAPKVGKSALLIHLFAEIKKGNGTCLGKPARKPWNKLIISGNDMSSAQWLKYLLREGLATCVSGDYNSPDAQFLPSEDVILWDQGRPARLDESGIEAMRAMCERHPDSLLVIDSLRSNIDSSYDENKAEIREPIERAKEALAGCEVTVVLVHHARKGEGGSSAISAAAGSNAISAACDGTLYMRYLTGDGAMEGSFRSDYRVMATSLSRLPADSAVLELTTDGLGQWKHHGDVEMVAQEQAVYAQEEKLSNRQEQVYDHACEIAENNVHTTVMEIATQFRLTRQKARKTLEQLVRKGLLARCGYEEQLEAGRPGVLYAPTLSSLARVKRENKEALNTLITHIEVKEPLDPLNPPCTPSPRTREQSLTKHMQQFPVKSRVERSDKGGIWIVTCNIDPNKIRLEKWGQPDIVSRVSYTLLRPCLESNATPAVDEPASTSSTEASVQSDQGSGVLRGDAPLPLPGEVASAFSVEDIDF